MTEPTPGDKITAALIKAAEELTAAGHTATAQAAMGRVFRGDLVNARKALAKLPPEKVREVSAAAATLSVLADDLLRGE